MHISFRSWRWRLNGSASASPGIVFWINMMLLLLPGGEGLLWMLWMHMRAPCGDGKSHQVQDPDSNPQDHSQPLLVLLGRLKLR
jgi:hypothetical protein